MGFVFFSCALWEALILLEVMGYAEKLRKLCLLRGLDQSSLAERVGVSKASMSRILNGSQEPKLHLAHELARALGVTLDRLVGDSPADEAMGQWVVVTEDELTVLQISRRLGLGLAIDRLLGVSVPRSRKGQARSKRVQGQAASKLTGRRPRG
jgi:transcriptional regulator with XRE-family HTH domain